MTERIYNYFIGFLPNSPTKKRLYENFLSLSLLKGLTYLFPLISLPYLVRILGPEKYGLIVFAQSLVNYFNIITDYGFNLSATKEISINRENINKVSEIFSTVIFIKLFLFIFSLVIFSIIVFSFPKFRSDYLIFYYSFILVFSNTFFPVWLFQGMEKMKFITYITLFARVFFLICIFVFIHSQDQYELVPLFNSLGHLISSLLAIYLAVKCIGISIIRPSFQSVKYQVKNGWYFFVSTFFGNFYTSSNIFILGILTNNQLVAYYHGADRIIYAFKGLLVPISQTVFPFFSNLYNKSEAKSINALKRLGVLISTLSFILSIIIFIYSPIITKLILGDQFTESVIIMRIMSFVPFVVSLSNIFATQGLFAFKGAKSASKIFIFASLFHIPTFIILTSVFSIKGAAFTVLFTEILVSAFSYLKFKNSLALNKKTYE